MKEIDIYADFDFLTSPHRLLEPYSQRWDKLYFLSVSR